MPSILEPSLLQYLLRESILYAGLFFAAKLLIPGFWGKGKENLYLLFAIILTTLFLTAYQLSPFTGFEAITELVPIGFLFFYFHRIHGHPKKRAVIETCMIVIFRWAVQALFTLFELYLHWDAFRSSSITFGEMVIHNIASAMLHFVFLAVLIRFLRPKLQKVYENTQMQTIFAWGLALVYLIPVSVLQVLQLFIGETAPWWTENPAGVVIVLLPSISSAILSLVLGLCVLTVLHNKRMKEATQRYLEYYTEQIEEQQSAMRKFKHDYQNILTALSGFIYDEDWSGLTAYYTTRIEPASAVITKNDFALEALSRIKPREIKGLLVSKLMMAQNLGIDTTFEMPDEINHFPVDSVALVRMLGIILDNAIEELTTLGKGKLLVACYKDKRDFTFVVQNTCRPALPTLRQIEKIGYSTKGKGRGLGLSNLVELVNASPNITLKTSIDEGNFIQKLTLTGGL